MSETPGVYQVTRPPTKVGGEGSIEDKALIENKPLLAAWRGKVDRPSVKLAWGRAQRQWGRTNRQIAVACGVTAGTVSAWANGRRTPSVECLVRAAVFLGTTPADLLGWFGPAGDRVNADCLRVALDVGDRKWTGTRGDADLRIMGELLEGLTSLDPDEKRRHLQNVLARIVEDLFGLETERAILSGLIPKPVGSEE